VRCFCVFVGDGLAQKAGDWFVYVTARHSVSSFTIDGGQPCARMTYLQLQPATSSTVSWIQSVIRPHRPGSGDHPPSSTNIKHIEQPPSPSSSTHDGSRSLFNREIRFVYPSPPRITILYSLSNNNNNITHPIIPSKDRNNSFRIKHGKGSSSIVCCRCTLFPALSYRRWRWIVYTCSGGIHILQRDPHPPRDRIYWTK